MVGDGVRLLRRGREGGRHRLGAVHTREQHASGRRAVEGQTVRHRAKVEVG